MVIDRAVWKASAEWLYRDVDAAAVANEIVSIGETATAEEILELGRDESTELHKCFEWDDGAAAELWRKQQARMIVCHLVIKTEQKNEEDAPLEIRVFHRASGDGYKPAQIIFQKEDEYEAMLRRAYDELQAFKRKYSILTELEEILSLIP